MTYRKYQVTTVRGETPEQLAERITRKMESLKTKYAGQTYQLVSVESMADLPSGYISFIVYSFSSPGESSECDLITPEE